MIADKLFKRGFSSPLLLCVSEQEDKGILEEVHEGACGNHIRARALAGKILRAGFYWPNLHEDAARYVRCCDKCQYHAPGEPLKFVLSPWPFFMWGVDIVGPFPIGAKQARWIIVVVDYFIKWVEAKPFASEKVIEFCRGKGIQNTFVSVEHPQANGQAESANKVILRALKRRRGALHHGIWFRRYDPSGNKSNKLVQRNVDN
ncbi:gag-pol polyprotein [Trifolium pratense]|uniref:Gag-pol polyprotein n=1 Tax=Trifolium pratense TaxID=57577 RepID=A0A2K3LQV0_TRIPR|nr:gag-pol polyprotein [Trifolium pratense]